MGTPSPGTPGRGLDPARVLVGMTIVAWGASLLGLETGLYRFEVDPLALWPVAIVALGLSIMPRGNRALDALAWVLCALTLAAVVALGLPTGEPGPVRDVPTRIHVAPDPSASSLSIEVEAGAGRLAIRGGGTDAVAGQYKLRGAEPSVLSDTSPGGVQHVSILRPAVPGVASNVTDVDLVVNATKPLTLKVSAGAASIDADLRETRLRELFVQGGASKVEVTLGREESLQKVGFAGGASTIRVRVPRDLAAQLLLLSEHTVALDLPERFQQRDRATYQTDDFGTATHRVEITVSSSVSSVSIEEY